METQTDGKRLFAATLSKERQCVYCGRGYYPTGIAQKLCPQCIVVVRGGVRKESMTKLRENVSIITGTGTKLEGHLFVGTDGLPVLKVKEDAVEGEVWQTFTPAQFPAAWGVYYQPGNADDLLLNTWRAISLLRQEIADAQREAEAETPQARCEIEQFKADRDARGGR